MNAFAKRLIGIFLVVAIIAPAPLLMAPQRAQAITSFETNPLVVANTVISAIKNTLTSVSSATSAAAEVAMLINTEVMAPLAFIMSGQLLKMMTASILAFVAGQINGTGAPQFVQNLNANLQQVGDSQAFSFFARFQKNSNSPFAASINSSLRTNYLQQTSQAGFFAANRDTLPRYSSNPSAFLSGNWSKGGIGSWFALTTQDNNNPYIYYQNAERALTTAVNSATAARQQELSWNQGFLSWCGESEVTGVTDADLNMNDSGESGVTDADLNMNESAGTNPGDACTNKDGTPGTVKTPGSVIKSYLDRALGSQFGKLEGLGQLGKQVTGILGNIATVMSTVNFAQQVLGGPSSGGISGVIQSGPGGTRTQLSTYRNAPTLGVTPQSVYQTGAEVTTSSSDKASIISQYESAWGIIRGSAETASSSIQKLIRVCSAVATLREEDIGSRVNISSFKAASAEQVRVANDALQNQVAPVLAQARAAAQVVANARLVMAQLQSGANATSTDSSEYAAKLLQLQSMAPTAADVANAQQDTQNYGFGSANPEGSLNAAGNSIVERMGIISTNAALLETSVCSSSAYRTSGGSNGD